MLLISGLLISKFISKNLKTNFACAYFIYCKKFKSTLQTSDSLQVSDKEIVDSAIRDLTFQSDLELKNHYNSISNLVSRIDFRTVDALFQSKISILDGQTIVSLMQTVPLFTMNSSSLLAHTVNSNNSNFIKHIFHYDIALMKIASNLTGGMYTYTIRNLRERCGDMDLSQLANYENISSYVSTFSEPTDQQTDEQFFCQSNSSDAENKILKIMYKAFTAYQSGLSENIDKLFCIEMLNQLLSSSLRYICLENKKILMADLENIKHLIKLRKENQQDEVKVKEADSMLLSLQKVEHSLNNSERVLLSFLIPKINKRNHHNFYNNLISDFMKHHLLQQLKYNEKSCNMNDVTYAYVRSNIVSNIKHDKVLCLNFISQQVECCENFRSFTNSVINQHINLSESNQAHKLNTLLKHINNYEESLTTLKSKFINHVVSKEKTIVPIHAKIIFTRLLFEKNAVKVLISPLVEELNLIALFLTEKIEVALRMDFEGRKLLNKYSNKFGDILASASCYDLTPDKLNLTDDELKLINNLCGNLMTEEFVTFQKLAHLFLAIEERTGIILTIANTFNISSTSNNRILNFCYTEVFDLLVKLCNKCFISRMVDVHFLFDLNLLAYTIMYRFHVSEAFWNVAINNQTHSLFSASYKPIFVLHNTSNKVLQIVMQKVINESKVIKHTGNTTVLSDFLVVSMLMDNYVENVQNNNERFEFANFRTWLKKKFKEREVHALDRILNGEGHETRLDLLFEQWF